MPYFSCLFTILLDYRSDNVNYNLDLTDAQFCKESNCYLAVLFLYLFSFRKKELFSFPLSLYIATASLSLQLPCEAREDASNTKLD